MRHSAQLEEDFPNLASSGYEIASDPALPPNCIGYALRDSHHVWDANGAAIRAPGHMWLPSGPYNFEITTVAEIFSRHGYQDCDLDVSLELGYEKIAIYADENNTDEPFQHVARQLPDGHWTSKLGPDEDINHDMLEALEGDPRQYPKAYGHVVQVMKRRVT